ncbi:MAG: FISUMP domain-containing protein [Chitinophagales bacterium]
MKNRTLKLIMVALSALFIFSCKKDTKEPESFKFEKTQYYPAELAQINTTGIILTQANYTATLNGSNVTLIAYQKSLVLPVPDLSAGSYTLIVNIDGKEYRGDFTLLTSPLIADPQTVFNTQISKLNNSVSDLQIIANSLPADRKSKLLADIAIIDDWKTQLQSQFDTLSPSEKLNCARAIEANSWWIDEITNGIDSFRTQTVNLRIGLTGIEDYEKKVDRAIVNYLKPLFVLLIKDIPKIVACTATGAVVGSGIPVIGTGIGATVGLGIAIGNYITDARKLIVAEGRLLDATFEPMNAVETENQRIMALSYTNNVRTQLKITNNYRTPYKNDRTNPVPVVKDIIDFTDADDVLFQQINDILPQQLSFNPPSIDDYTSYSITNRDVHSNYVTITNISNSKVTMTMDKQDGSVFVTFKTTETAPQNFSYTVQYDNPRFGNYSKTVSATLTTDSTVTDIDGNVYRTVRIGTQVWMAENLKTTRYNDGTAIPTGLSNSAWQNTTSGAYSVYNNDAANNTTYGKLYNWYAVNTGKLAPAGWHVPTNAEWNMLITYLGGDVAGGKLKSTTLWNSPNTGATNSSGFAGLPGGERRFEGTYDYIGESGYWWSSTYYVSGYAWFCRLDDDDSSVYRDSDANMIVGQSVRCVKD